MTLPRLAVALALGAALAGGAAMAAEPSAAEQAVYMERFENRILGKGVTKPYDPVEAIPGAASYQPLPAAAPADRSVAVEALDKARDYARANRSSAFIVYRDGAIQTADYFGDTTAAKPLVSFSLAKPMTAVAVGRAIQLGFIKSLDAPMTTFIPEWKGTPKAAMTLRMVLEMRSGFKKQEFAGPEVTDPKNILNIAYMGTRVQDTLIHDYPLTHKPGERYDYSNANGELISIVIERATKQRYAAFISKQVIQPLGAAGGDVWVDRVGGLAHSGCCMMLPAESWLRLGVLMLNDGVWNGKRLLPAGYVAELKRGSAQNPYYGAGVYPSGTYIERRGAANPDTGAPGVLHGEPYAAEDLFLFDGNANQVVYIVPSAKLVVLRMGSSPPKTPEWDNAVLPNILLRGLKLKPGETLAKPQSRSQDQAIDKPKATP